MVLLTVCAPLAMTLFLLLMERLEAALFPIRGGAAAGPADQRERPRAELEPPEEDGPAALGEAA